MATNIVTLLRSLQGLEVGPNASPITVIDEDGNWVGYIKEQTPVKTAAAEGLFALTGDVVDGELVTIGTDIYEFDADAAVTEGNLAVDISGGTKTQATAIYELTGTMLDGETITVGDDVYEATTTGTASGSNIAIDLSLVSTAATGQLTFTGIVSDGELVVLGEDTFEFDTNDAVTEGNIQVFVGTNTDATSACIALAAAIEAAGTQPLSANKGVGDTVDVTADYHRSSDNDIATTTTCANATWGALHLENGADATAAACVTAIVAAVTAHDTMDIGAADGTGDTVDFTADIGGAVDGSLGNAVALATDAANGDWDGEYLAGGTDATNLEAITALVAKITSDGDGTYTATDETGGEMSVDAVSDGDAGNLIVTTTTCANGNWDGETTLVGGADGTPAVKGTRVQDASYLYVAVDDTEDSTGWKKIALSSL
jgi:hypothetical protein